MPAENSEESEESEEVQEVEKSMEAVAMNAVVRPSMDAGRDWVTSPQGTYPWDLCINDSARGEWCGQVKPSLSRQGMY